MLGRAAADSPIDIVVALRLRDQAAVDHAIAAASDPTSPSYGNYLTQDEANALFDPTPDQQQQVVGWLHGHGLSVKDTSPNHLLVQARGTVAQVSRIFGVTINNYEATRHGKAVRFYSNANDPTVDSSVSGVVDDVLGLDNYPAFDTPAFTNGSAHGTTPYYPQDFANAYDVNPVWNASPSGYTGAGQHIGITLWETPPSDTTLNAFQSTTGAAVATRGNGRLNVVQVDNTTSSYPDSAEAAMDIEYSSGMAPGATIDYYEATQPDTSDLAVALNRAGTAVDADGRPLDRQITSSWGGSEDPCCTSTIDNILASNTATGHAYFFSSGDSGSATVASNCTVTDPSPDYPASSAYATAVGGTSFSTTVGAGWPGEDAWVYAASSGQAPCSNAPEGSGGGYSNIFSRPNWQSGVAGLSSANSKRGYPDVSADADPNTGAYVETTAGTGPYGGTSLSSPLWAGMTALLNQYLQANHKGLAGFLNPTLYSLAQGGTGANDFHDITSGTNGTYSTTSGWDAVTGWGSPDLNKLVQDWPTSADTTLPVAQITTKPAADTNSTSAAFGFSVTDADNAGNQLTITCSLDSAAPSSCSPSAATSYTGLAAGSHTFTVRAFDPAGNTGSATYTWTVDTTAPTVQLANQPATVTSNTSAVITVSASDPDDTSGNLTITCTVDTSPVGCGNAATGLANGSHTFTAQAADPAGNIRTATYTWTVDTTPPAVQITSHPAASTNAISATFTYTAADPDSANLTTTCTLDGTAVTCPGPYTSLGDGAHHFTVTSADAAGNTGSATYAWTVDTTAPTASITSAPPALTNSSTALFTFATSDPDNATVTSSCTLDGGSTTCSGSYPALATGTHTLDLTVSDSVGNTATTSYTWTVDTVAPAGAVKVGSGAPFTLAGSTPISWTGTDTGSTVSSFDVRWRRAAYNGRFGGWQQPAEWQHTTATAGRLSLAAGSTYCVSVRATDAAGNESGWSPARCVTRPVDDRTLAHSSGWSRATGRSFYLGTLSTTAAAGKSLSITATSTAQLALVVSRCSSCGTVGVYVDGKLFKKISLAARRAANQQLVVLPRIRLGRHVISLRNLTARKSIKIDGLAMSAA